MSNCVTAITAANSEVNVPTTITTVMPSLVAEKSGKRRATR